MPSNGVKLPAHHNHRIPIIGQMACIIRVPTELVKQRMQTSAQASIGSTVQAILANEGLLGLWRGYGSLVMREACLR